MSTTHATDTHATDAVSSKTTARETDATTTATPTKGAGATSTSGTTQSSSSDSAQGSNPGKGNWWKDADGDADSRISLAEAAANADLTGAFTKMDIDSDGFVTQAEYTAYSKMEK